MFPGMSEDQRQQSINTATGSQWRLFSAWPLVWFGVFEQITALCLSIAQGLTFISFACAILFAFFKRTEGIAWSLVDQWLALIVQAVIIAMIQALVVSFFLAGAATNNGLVRRGYWPDLSGLHGDLVMVGDQGHLAQLQWLFDAMSKATGGVMVSPGAAVQTAAAAGTALATGGMSLAGNALGGASALMGGASWAQAAGITFGGSQTLTGAARMLTRLPGLRDSELEEVADHFVEGAATRQVARPVPGIGRVTGPVVARRCYLTAILTMPMKMMMGICTNPCSSRQWGVCCQALRWGRAGNEKIGLMRKRVISQRGNSRPSLRSGWGHSRLLLLSPTPKKRWIGTSLNWMLMRSPAVNAATTWRRKVAKKWSSIFQR